MLTCESLLPMLDARVASILLRQVLDRSRLDYGGFVEDGVAGGTGVGNVVPLCYAYLLEGSAHYRSTELLERILLGAGFGRRVRRDSVRKNLDLSYHLLHADGTVVTSVSQRQDRGSQTIPLGLVDSYYAMARMEENGFYAAVADWLIDQEPGGLPWTLHPFLEHPEWREDNLKREPLPESYSKVFPVSGIWRVRRGRMSATEGILDSEG